MAKQKNNTASDYKSSPIGLIPNDWEIGELKKLTSKVGSGITPSGGQKVYKTNGIPFLRSQNVGWGQFLLDDVAFIDEAMHKTFISTEIKKMDVLLNITGASIGRSAVVIDEIIGGNVNQHVCILRTKQDFLNPHYLNAYLLSTIGQNLIDSYQAGGNRQGLNFEQIKSFKIPLPSIKEQITITNLLRAWDNAILNTTQLITKKEQRKKWLMQQLLTGKKRLKGFEKDKWKKHNYEDVLKVVKRPIEWNDEELYRLISVRRRSGGIFAREALLGKQILVKNLRNVNEGDFLFSKMQILHGASALVTKEFADYKISGSYIATVAKDPKILNMEFFEWYSRLPFFYHQTYISSYGVHIEKMTFDWDSFISLDLKLPSIQEQKEIVKLLNTSSKEIKLLQNKRDQLKEQKKGLMQVLLTGKKRLKIK